MEEDIEKAKKQVIERLNDNFRAYKMKDYSKEDALKIKIGLMKHASQELKKAHIESGVEYGHSTLFCLCESIVIFDKTYEEAQLSTKHPQKQTIESINWEFREVKYWFSRYLKEYGYLNEHRK